MSKPNQVDHTKTRNYIPIVSTDYPPPICYNFQCFEKRCIHEGRFVYPDFEDFNYLEAMLSSAKQECHYKINELVVPRFILEFYSQFRFRAEPMNELYVEFFIQEKIVSYLLPDFGHILGIPTTGQCSFT